MKKIILILSSVLILGNLVGCGKSSDKVPENSAKQVEKEEVTQEPKKEAVVQTKKNEYIQNQPITSINTIHISPKYVRYEGDTLVMDAFVYNGYEKPVFNINNIEIEVSNNEGIIAHAGFASMDGARIEPKNYIVWTFKFGPDAIKNKNADLEQLTTKFRCNNNY